MMENTTFEEAFVQLETTVSSLQGGQLPLERALELYQEGVKLVQYCSTLLQQAELTVQQLNGSSDGDITLQTVDVLDE